MDTIVEQTYDDFEVVVVDNDSDDDTVEIVSTYSDNLSLTLIENDCNLGFSDGMNRGIAETDGDYICCYNHDTYFPPEYLETLSESVTSDAVWTTARENHRVSKEHRTVRLLDWQRYAVPYLVDSISGTVTVNFVPGDGVIIPREIFEENLGDKVFELPARGEDVDLSRRLTDAGVPMRAVLDTYSVHPDTGIYRPTVVNAREHLTHARMRWRAYRRNTYTPMDLFFIALSVVTVPLVVLFGRFPRSTIRFEQRVTGGSAGGNT